MSEVSTRKKSAAFIVCVVVLVLAAATLNGAVKFLNLHFKKEPVPLAIPLEKIPAQIGPWVQVSVDETLNPEFLDVLGTKEYIFRTYVDSRIVSEEQIKEFQGKDLEERNKLQAILQQAYPTGVMRLCVTYYTGMVDTVAHIPDRCYVADGYEPTEVEKPTWHLRDRQSNPIDVEVRYINFEDTTPGRGATIARNVAYVFHCNGEYESDPIAGVRMRLQNLNERKGYYAKVELMNIVPHKKAAEQVMEQFLADVLPDIERCFPDWKAVNAAPARK